MSASLSEQVEMLNALAQTFFDNPEIKTKRGMIRFTSIKVPELRPTILKSIRFIDTDTQQKIKPTSRTIEHQETMTTTVFTLPSNISSLQVFLPFMKETSKKMINIFIANTQEEIIYNPYQDASLSFSDIEH